MLLGLYFYSGSFTTDTARPASRCQHGKGVYLEVDFAQGDGNGMGEHGVFIFFGRVT